MTVASRSEREKSRGGEPRGDPGFRGRKSGGKRNAQDGMTQKTRKTPALGEKGVKKPLENSASG